MSMVIGKEARTEIGTILKTALEADEEARRLLHLKPADRARLTLSYIQDVLGILNRCTDAPEVGLPEGWVAVPVEPSEKMTQALALGTATSEPTTDPIGFCMRQWQRTLSAAPPCPGVVSLPEVNWPFVEEALREYADALTDGGLDGAGRSLPADIVEYADEIARWLESADQKESGE